MHIFVKSYIQRCILCQQMKVNTYLSALPLTPIKADPYAYLFLTVTMDFIISLSKLNEYNALYIIVDYNLIKTIVLIPCTKTINIIKTVRLYYNNIYQRFRLPNRIISDRGPQFSSQVFQEINKQLGVTLSISTAFHL